jgi:hypothetical protein
MQKRKMPRDPNQAAKLLAEMAWGEAKPEPATEKDPERVARGKLGGGKMRAEKLSPERRAEIARNAAEARWMSRPQR